MDRNCSATELAAKVGTKRKRTGHEAPEDIAWTASRCNRLLRTITSRINILQKLSRPASGKSKAIPALENASAPQERPNSLVIAVATPTKDPEWLPPVNNRITTKTYAGRMKVRQAVKDLNVRGGGKDVGLGFPTPFVKRILNPDMVPSNSEPDDSISTLDFGIEDRPARKTKKLAIRPTSSVDEAHRNLTSALESLLTITKAETTQDRKGASSLMKMCLRQVPQYVELEELEFEGEDEENKFDVAFDLYSELESLGTREGGGWMGLRTIVRAHGLRKIDVAIRKGLLPTAVVDALVQKCTEHGAIREAQMLMRSSLKKATTTNAITVSDFTSHCETEDSHEFLLRMLAELLNSGSLTPQAASEKPAVWRLVMKALSNKSTQTEGSDFLQAWIEAYLRTAPSFSDSRLASSFRSVMVLVAAMAVTSIEGNDSPAISPSVVFRIATNTYLQSISRLDAARNNDLTVSLFTTALILYAIDGNVNIDFQYASIEHLTRSMNLETNTQSNSKQRSLHQRSADFICDIAKCLRRVDDSLGNETLKSIVHSIVNISKECPATTSPFLEKLAIDTAMAWSDCRMDKASLDFAEDIEDTIARGSRASSLQTPRPKTKVTKYRWEEGLCEWIAMTPMSIARVDEQPTSSPVFDRRLASPENMPNRPSPRMVDERVGNAGSDATEPPSSPAPAVRTPLAPITPSALNRTLSNSRPSKQTAVKRPPSPEDDITLVEENYRDEDEDELGFGFSVKKPRPSVVLIDQSSSQPLKLPSAPLSNHPPEPRVSLSNLQAWDVDEMSDDELGM